MDSRGEKDLRQGSLWKTRACKAVAGRAGKGWWMAEWAVPLLSAHKLEGTTREQDRPYNPEFHYGEIKLQNL